MKSIFFMVLAIIIFPLSSQAGSKYQGCDNKIYQLEKQLSYAKRYGNKYRVAGLERAIANAQGHCYDHYSGATGATRLNSHYYLDETKQLEKEIDLLKDEIERLKDLNK
ncbi:MULTISPECIES: DUF1090 family protein [Providencia]|uniref:Periplasmic protein n=2 Tax=Providencia heimbachae TaxID=333962 RepID=A0A1B7JJA8_9GAMM|nr:MULTISPECIES: DUF1090 family protein [Providencia]MBP6122827.1 DUF1090 family protein [Providencia sp.]NIH22080.1 DUF1090 family protein [Providencia heimbachae]OAT47986.1 hypothetical protein M998_3412 [Providencia heimbachae ATCC 35613]QCJ69552.1 DUF1090 domain-containing protein [Providencia heimbachae]SQH12634.1 Protein of uncharacterised function (DUF1090) [Providencia heimbachae]